MCRLVHGLAVFVSQAMDRPATGRECCVSPPFMGAAPCEQVIVGLGHAFVPSLKAR